MSSEDRARTIGRALAARAGSVTAVDNGWAFALVNGAKFDARATLADDWLEVTVPLASEAELAPARVWSMLRLNGSLDTMSRVAVAPGKRTAHIRAELCVEARLLHDDVSLGPRVEALLESVGRGRHAYDEWWLYGQDSVAKAPVSWRGPTADFLHLCSEVGWPCVERDGGQWSIAIAEGSSACEAAVGVADAGPLHFTANLVNANGLSFASRGAIGVLLLGVSAVVRSIKGFAWRDGEREYAGVAAVCGEPTSGTAIDQSLSALSVAFGMVGREVLALRDEFLAREYLERCASLDERPWSVDLASDTTMEPLATKL